VVPARSEPEGNSVVLLVPALPPLLKDRFVGAGRYDFVDLSGTLLTWDLPNKYETKQLIDHIKRGRPLYSDLPYENETITEKID
jgi:hypothetical protein